VVIRLTPQFTNFTSKKGAYRKAQELKARDKALLEELLSSEDKLPYSSLLRCVVVDNGPLFPQIWVWGRS